MSLGCSMTGATPIRRRSATRDIRKRVRGATKTRTADSSTASTPAARIAIPQRVSNLHSLTWLAMRKPIPCEVPMPSCRARNAIRLIRTPEHADSLPCHVRARPVTRTRMGGNSSPVLPSAPIATSRNASYPHGTTPHSMRHSIRSQERTPPFRAFVVTSCLRIRRSAVLFRRHACASCATPMTTRGSLSARWPRATARLVIERMRPRSASNRTIMPATPATRWPALIRRRTAGIAIGGSNPTLPATHPGRSGCTEARRRPALRAMPTCIAASSSRTISKTVSDVTAQRSVGRPADSITIATRDSSSKRFTWTSPARRAIPR